MLCVIEEREKRKTDRQTNRQTDTLLKNVGSVCMSKNNHACFYCTSCCAVYLTSASQRSRMIQGPAAQANAILCSLLFALTMTEQFGGTPLPPVSSDVPLKVWYDPSAVPGQAQQPHAQQVAAFEAVPNDDCINGSVLDVNQHFCVYAVKNGLIRVLHRSSSVRSLLRGHTSKVTDISFFQNGDVLGTVGGNLIIWRIFHRSPDILAEKLLEIPSTLPQMSRLVWHPFNPNQFWLLHMGAHQTTVATLVETTRITTVPHETESHAICQLHNHNVIMDGAVCIGANSNMTDLSWSGKDTKHVLTTHDDGTIRLWDVKKLADETEGLLPATCIVTLEQDEPVTRCMFLPHDNIGNAKSGGEGITSAFLTASRGNSLITLWSAFYATQHPTKLQTFGMEHASPAYNLNLCFGQAPPDGSPPAFFILLSDRSDGKVYAIHLETTWSTTPPKRALAVGLNYVIPFSIKYPIYSWSIACVPAEHVSEEEPIQGGLTFDMRFHAYQSKMVQQYTIPHYMCLPPCTTWNTTTPGVRAESLAAAPISSVEMTTYDEDYELDIEESEDDDEEEEDEENDDDVQAPEASSLPVPDGLDAANVSSNPFANWLGAIAAKTTGAPGNVPPPPTPVTAASTSSAAISSELEKAAPLPSMESAFLNPAELLSPGSMR